MVNGTLLIGGPEEGRALSIDSLPWKYLTLKQSYQSEKQRKRALNALEVKLLKCH